jgi:1-deoxy-D-xylulose-5-phosphate reductoisomerase
MKRIAILGSTGSIGRSTLGVVENYPDRFQISTLAAGGNVEAAVEQASRWKPRVLSLADQRDATGDLTARRGTNRLQQRSPPPAWCRTP